MRRPDLFENALLVQGCNQLIITDEPNGVNQIPPFLFRRSGMLPLQIPHGLVRLQEKVHGTQLGGLFEKSNVVGP